MNKQLFTIFALSTCIIYAQTEQTPQSAQQFFEQFKTQITQQPDRERIVVLMALESILYPAPTQEQVALEEVLCDRLKVESLTIQEKQTLSAQLIQTRIASFQLVDAGIVPFIKSLQEMGVRVIGITFNPPLVADIILNRIKTLDIDFTKTTITNTAELQLEVNKQTMGMYKNGIIFAHPTEQLEELLGNLFKQADFTASAIIVVGQAEPAAEQAKE